MTILIDSLDELLIPENNSEYSATHVSFGIPTPKQVRVRNFSPDDWEMFVQEWAHSLRDKYFKVLRSGGSGDFGLDVIGFETENLFEGSWHNYQCKHYDHPLHPSDIWPEIGKLIYYTHINEYSIPEKYYFAAPKDIGTSLGRLLSDPSKLKLGAQKNWPVNKITTSKNIPLKGDLKKHFHAFDFSIFTFMTVLELLDGHSKTKWHTTRFGGGLPPRPESEQPPDSLQKKETRYIDQLIEAYSDRLGKDLKLSALKGYPNFKRHFNRQRERFFHAESLRNFSRDTLPSGTFNNLQDEIFHGVVDISEGEFKDGLERVDATLIQASQVYPSSNPLSSAVKVQDKQGICHQLANEDRLIWVPIKK